MREVTDFLAELCDNNERGWFEAHRKAYLRAKEVFESFVTELIEGIASFDHSGAGLTVRDCTYRIYRDTRFSPDKTPYKNYMGAYVAPRGKKSGYAGYYFHVEPGGARQAGHSLLSAGLYCPDPLVLRSVREEVADHGAEIAAAIDAAAGFRIYEGNRLRRLPAGFVAGTPYDELLKLKDFYIERPMDGEFLCSDKLLESTVAAFRTTEPLVSRLNRAVKYAFEEMR